MLDPQLIRHHRDEFAIRRLRFRDIDRVAEKMADAVDIAARPGDFDRVTNRAFDAAWRCFVSFGDRRIQGFGNRAENFDIVVYHRYGFA